LLFLTLGTFTACEAPNNHESGAVSGSEQLRVVSSGGFTAAYLVLAPMFEAQTGIELITEFGASSGGAEDSIPMRLARDEAFDVIILSRSALDKLTSQGKVAPESRIDLVQSEVGMAIRAGAEIPDISTPQAFVSTLMEVESIGYSASASGTYLSTELWPELGIWDELKTKSRRIVSERVGAVVARGEVEIGFQQVSEILPIPGINFAGKIPDELQRVTTFSGGILLNAENREAADKLLEFFGSKEVAPIIEKQGLVAVINTVAR